MRSAAPIDRLATLGPLVGKLILVGIALATITLLDWLVFPSSNLTVLFAVPVLVAALVLSPRVVLGIAVVSLAIDLTTAGLHRDLTPFWPIRTTVLLVVDVFAVLLAHQREALVHQSTALRGANAQIHSILENATNAIIFIDNPTGRVTANPAARQLFGDSSVVMEESSNLMRVLALPSGQPLEEWQWPVTIARSGQSVAQQELLVERPNDEQVSILLSATPVRGAKGDPNGVVIVAQDISTLKELERQREEWISIVAHDLRQPITSIIGYAGLLKRSAGLSDGDRGRAIGHIATSARHVSRMIEDLLDVSRIESRRLALQCQSVDLVALIDGVIERIDPSVPNHRLTANVVGAIPRVVADPQRLEQILDNLLSNAAKYGDPGTDVRIEVQHQNSQVAVAVSNVGPGIPLDDATQLFERFYRTKSARSSGVRGLGLGLYITKGLVEAHGGRISVRSVPGRETTFQFTLPLDRDL